MLGERRVNAAVGFERLSSALALLFHTVSQLDMGPLSHHVTSQLHARK